MASKSDPEKWQKHINDDNLLFTNYHYFQVSREELVPELEEPWENDQDHPGQAFLLQLQAVEVDKAKRLKGKQKQKDKQRTAPSNVSIPPPLSFQELDLGSEKEERIPKSQQQKKKKKGSSKTLPAPIILSIPSFESFQPSDLEPETVEEPQHKPQQPKPLRKKKKKAAKVAKPPSPPRGQSSFGRSISTPRHFKQFRVEYKPKGKKRRTD